MLKTGRSKIRNLFSGINFNGALCNWNGGIEEEEPDRRWRRESQSNKLLVIIISIIFFKKKKKKKGGWSNWFFFFLSFGFVWFFGKGIRGGREGRKGRLWSEREEEGSIGTGKKEKMMDDGSVDRMDKFFYAVLSLPAKGKEPLSVNLPYLFSWIGSWMFGFISRIGPKQSIGLGFSEICVEPSITAHILTKSTKSPRVLIHKTICWVGTMKIQFWVGLAVRFQVQSDE